MSITLYYAPMSSATPVLHALYELEIPFERVLIDIRNGAQQEASYLALNPNGKVPTLVADGTAMFEALAIFHFLGERFGVDRDLWPAANSPDRMAALSWTCWAYVTYGAAIQRLNVSSSDRVPAELHHAPLTAYAKQELKRMLEVLEGHLRKQGFLAGDHFTLADLAVASVITYGTYCGALVDGHAATERWLERFAARPNYLRTWCEDS